MSRSLATLLCFSLTLIALDTFASAPSAEDTLIVISPDSRQSLSTTKTSGREMVTLDDLARLPETRGARGFSG